MQKFHTWVSSAFLFLPAAFFCVPSAFACCWVSLAFWVSSVFACCWALSAFFWVSQAFLFLPAAFWVPPVFASCWVSSALWVSSACCFLLAAFFWWSRKAENYIRSLDFSLVKNATRFNNLKRHFGNHARDLKVVEGRYYNITMKFASATVPP